MNVRCAIRMHKWNGCRCKECYKTREHDWSKDCERCARCSTTRDDAHIWKSGKCGACGKSIDEPDSDGRTRLTKAAFNGLLSPVQKLLKDGANVNAPNKDGMGALMWAAQKGHIEIVKTLIAVGADIQARTNVNNTALMLAAIGGHDEIVSALVEAGSDVNAADEDGNVVLMGAVQKCDARIVKLLLDRGANPHVGERAGDTILTNAILSGHADSVRLLVTRGAKLKWDAGTLVILGGDGHLEMTRLFLEQGADVNAREPEYGLTPLLSAAAYGRLLMVKYLIGKGADLSATDKFGNSALELAEMKGWTETVAYLESLAQGAQSESGMSVQPAKSGKQEYSMGSKGPGGGIVFFLEDSAQHGLEAFVKDSGEMDWPSASSRVSTLGDGWRLPTLDELLYLYQKKNLVGGFEDGFYWSSSEHQRDTTWYAVVFSNGNSTPLRKHGDACYVRAVRAF